MTRRGFFAALAPVTHSAVATTQFEVVGAFTEGGIDPHQAYFALGQSLALTLDPQKLPTMVKQAEALVGKSVRLTLEQA